jgi:hypothetical protein
MSCKQLKTDGSQLSLVRHVIKCYKIKILENSSNRSKLFHEVIASGLNVGNVWYDSLES